MKLKYKKEISAGGIVYRVIKTQKHKNTKTKDQNVKLSKANSVSRKSKVRGQRSQVLWLVTKHSKFGHWSFPKGLVGDVHEDEKMEEAALREVEEEGGVKAEIVKKLSEPVRYTYRWKDTLIKKTVHYYLMRYVSGDPKDHDWEVEEARFVGEEEVRELLTFKNDKKAFQHAIELYDKLSV